MGGNWRSAPVEMALKMLVLLGLAATAIQSVIVPRGLYADGAYNLWLVLNSHSYVVIGPARTFAILLNQTPVVSAMALGVRDLDVLIGFYTFGVAAVPILIWIAALLFQIRGEFFWQLTIIYSATFLTSGFIAIGEYNYAFALVALAVSALVTRGSIAGWRAFALAFSSVALVLSYEGMAFLGLPVALLILVRIKRRAWLADGTAGRVEVLVLRLALACAVLSVAVAAGSIGIRSLNSRDTNLAGAVNVSFAFDANHQWRLVAVVAILLMLSLFFSRRIVVVALRVAAALISLRLFLPSSWAPAWMHYNTRSLSTYTYFILLVLAIAAMIVTNRRLRGASRVDARPATGAPERLALAGAVSLVAMAMSISFWSLNLGYADWLGDLRGVVTSNHGPVDIAATDLYGADNSQFSWGWSNPYLSTLLQTQYGQGQVISHVETIDNYTPISPPSSPEFFERYHRSR